MSFFPETLHSFGRRALLLRRYSSATAMSNFYSRQQSCHAVIARLGNALGIVEHGRRGKVLIEEEAARPGDLNHGAFAEPTRIAEVDGGAGALEQGLGDEQAEPQAAAGLGALSRRHIR